jgi:hypothetical protein
VSLPSVRDTFLSTSYVTRMLGIRGKQLSVPITRKDRTATALAACLRFPSTPVFGSCWTAMSLFPSLV